MPEEIEDPTLADADGESESKYGWDEDFQRHIAALLIADKQFMLQSMDLIKPSYFTNKVHSFVSSMSFEFFKKYRILPRKDFIVQEIKTQFKDNKALAYYLAEVNVLFDYFQPGLDARDYLRDKIVYFAKIQAVKNAFFDSMKLIEKSPESEDTWNKIYEKMRVAMTTQQNFDVGVDYFKNLKERYDDMGIINPQDIFVTGFESIDKEVEGGGFNKGEIFGVVAASGVGKSVWLACVTATNLLRGKKCLYVTLELADRKVANRMDAILTGFPIQNLFGHKTEILHQLENLSQIKREGDIWPLVIKQFPGRSVTVNTLRAYVSQLAFYGFKPDLLVVDYVGEMADYPDMKIHDSREKIVGELRGMAKEEDLFILTAFQTNREAKKDAKNDKSRVDEEHIADSYGQLRPLDGGLSIYQNNSEKSLGIGRGNIIKLRDGKSKFQIYLGFDQKNLRITEISQHEYLTVMNAHKEFASDQTKIDMITEKGWEPSDKDGERVN